MIYLFLKTLRANPPDGDSKLSSEETNNVNDEKSENVSSDQSQEIAPSETSKKTDESSQNTGSSDDNLSEKPSEEPSEGPSEDSDASIQKTIDGTKSKEGKAVQTVEPQNPLSTQESSSIFAPTFIGICIGFIVGTAITYWFMNKKLQEQQIVIKKFRQQRSNQGNNDQAEKNINLKMSQESSINIHAKNTDRQEPTQKHTNLKIKQTPNSIQLNIKGSSREERGREENANSTPSFQKNPQINTIILTIKNSYKECYQIPLPNNIAHQYFSNVIESLSGLQSDADTLELSPSDSKDFFIRWAEARLYPILDAMMDFTSHLQHLNSEESKTWLRSMNHIWSTINTIFEHDFNYFSIEPITLYKTKYHELQYKALDSQPVDDEYVDTIVHVKGVGLIHEGFRIRLARVIIGRERL